MTIDVVYTVPSLDVRDGGPPYTVAAGSLALSKLAGCRVHVATRMPDSGDLILPGAGVDVHRIDAFPFTGISMRRFLRSMAATRSLVVHDQGIWAPFNTIVTGLALAQGIPYAVSPHGMLEPWALRYRRWKKRLVRALYQDRLLRGACCLFAASEMEFDGIRAAGLKGPVAVVPHGTEIDIPDTVRTVPASPRVALFLSRIHPKKGLGHAIEAWAKLRPADWQLRIVGPGDPEYVDSLQQLAQRHGLTGAVSFHAAVTGREKFQCYRDADLFILPTYSENFGVVVLEALASGLPVLTTTGTPWRNLPALGCGWIVEPGTAPLAMKLAEVLAMPAGTLADMGARGRSWVSTEFPWSRNAERSLAVYRWMLERGPLPDIVRLD